MDLLLEMCREQEVTMLMVTHDRALADLLPARFDCTHLVREIDR
jgi:ABC-type lipoprotein export system ATPase subunit